MAEKLSRRTKRGIYVAMAVLALLVGAVTLSLPQVVAMGTSQFKLVVFHGASTWANLVTFSLAGVLGAVFLASRRKGVYEWESAFRYVSMPLWLVNTGLGLLSATLSWSGFSAGELLSEPRLQATFWILLGSAIIVAVDSVVDRPWIAAVLDLALAGSLWYLILTASPYLHPDNPMRSPDTDPAIRLSFLVMAAGLLAFWTLVTALVRSRIGRGGGPREESSETRAAVAVEESAS